MKQRDIRWTQTTHHNNENYYDYDGTENKWNIFLNNIYEEEIMTLIKEPAYKEDYNNNENYMCVFKRLFML